MGDTLQEARHRELLLVVAAGIVFVMVLAVVGLFHKVGTMKVKDLDLHTSVDRQAGRSASTTGRSIAPDWKTED